MDTSDIIATVAAVMAFGSTGVAGWALKYARSQAETAKQALAESRRAAAAGEKSADAADKAAIEAKRSADAAEESNRIAEEALAASRPADVDWKIEGVNEYRFRLRNIGTQTAANVCADSSRVLCTNENLPDGLTVPRNGGHDFMLFIEMGSGPLPTELYLTWEGQAEPVAVPMPSA
ncbi:hypothetical protein ACFTS5_17455 [Nocardia sp. NPDC056952]|uniref:hypothetical protein n=1 Tax=Nocardia sp. NPDC056952 TaxID=3345979 RepID=UPI00363E3B3B